MEIIKNYKLRRTMDVAGADKYTTVVNMFLYERILRGRQHYNKTITHAKFNVCKMHGQSTLSTTL